MNFGGLMLSNRDRLSHLYATHERTDLDYCSLEESPHEPHKFRLDDFLGLIGEADVEDGAVADSLDTHARLIDEETIR